MSFKLFGTKIYISFLFAATLCLMLIFDRTGLALPTLFAIFIHETAHLFTMWALDCAPKQIRLIPASVQIVSDFSAGYNRDIAVSVMGPLSNFLLFGCLYLNHLRYGNQGSLVYALLNLIIGVFNLLPVTGLDGGRILYSLLAKRQDPNRANLILKIVTLIFAAAALFLAVTLTIRGKLNLSLYIIALYLVVISILKT